MELPTRAGQNPPQGGAAFDVGHEGLGTYGGYAGDDTRSRPWSGGDRDEILARKARAVAYANRVAAGETRALARLITLLEDHDPEAIEIMRILRGNTGRARTIGITGPPGAGKSTLVTEIIRSLRKRGSRVGVLAVDPSSPFTGGAILGDRLRMQEHATDEGVFMRSLASRGHLGGLSRATGSAARALDAAGFDYILIETVGVGQSEVDIVSVADAVVLISVPGLGDDIQVIKAGIMEIGDIFVVNKADREGADRVVREIRGMLETAATLAMGRPVETPDSLSSHHHAGLGRMARPSGAGAASLRGGANFALDETGHPVLPPVLRTVAQTGEGTEELVGALFAHFAELDRTGLIEARRIDAARAEIRDLVHARVSEMLAAERGASLEERLAWGVVARAYDTWEAADRLCDSMLKGGIS